MIVDDNEDLDTFQKKKNLTVGFHPLILFKYYAESTKSIFLDLPN